MADLKSKDNGVVVVDDCVIRYNKKGYTPYVIKDLGSHNKKFVTNEFNLFILHLTKK